MKSTAAWQSETYLTDSQMSLPYQGDDSRRGHRRAPLKLPVQFELTGGPVISAHTYDLSINGMQIRCEHPHLSKLAGTQNIDPNLGVLVVMRLQLDNRISCQVLRCRISYLKKLKTDEVSMGLQFDALLPDQQLALLGVLEQRQS